MTQSFSGRCALVTGGRSGIGFAFARELAARGARVIITSRDPGSVGTRASLGAISNAAAAGTETPSAIAWDMDVPRSDAGVMTAIVAAGAHVDIVVHAAHVFSPHRLIVAMKPDELGISLQQNVVAPYALLRRLTREMARARFGRVLIVSSLVASLGGAGQAAYIAEKSALEGLTRAFASEFGSRDVLVNAIAPGIVDTEHVRNAVAAEVADVVARHALSRRLATPDEVAIAAMSLLDPRQGYVTGQVLRIAGGMDVLAAPLDWSDD
jgi:3-oxoacyl-[acyl-carrier protein] reductase